MIIVAAFVVFLFVNILVGWVHFKYFRKCPYCHERMHYQYKKTDKNRKVECYVFHCTHCGAFENVTPVEMIEEEYGTK